jgi:signal transduction histidine kinase
MPDISARNISSLEIAFSILTLVIIITAAYAVFFVDPYKGFRFSAPLGEITNVFTPLPDGDSLQVGDRIVQVADITWSEFHADRHVKLFGEIRPGKAATFVVLRDGKQQVVNWVYPDFNQVEFVHRLFYPWWISFFFWAAGLATLLFVRPHDKRRLLLAAFDFLTAVWLAAGTISLIDIWNSGKMMNTAIWLGVPVTWQLNWEFPRAFRKSPFWMWLFLYLCAAGMCALIWLDVLPFKIYYFGLLLSALGGLLLLFAHALIQPRQRDQVLILLGSLGIALLPGITLSVVRIFNNTLNWLEAVSLWTLILIPCAYFYAVNRRQLGGLELRANRAITGLIYIMLLFTVIVLAMAFTSAFFHDPSKDLTIGVVAAFLASLISMQAYPHFRRWFERRILGMPLTPTSLAEAYSTRISTSLDRQRLVSLLQYEVFPSLFIRQAALLQLEGLDRNRIPKDITPILTLGIGETQQPQKAQIPTLLNQAGHPRPVHLAHQDDQPCPWARLVLKLSIEGQIIGVCLLGRRDPDDHYPSTDIRTLQALMDQTALALLNISQSERLHGFYQADIERQEDERKSLARELHDDVLAQLALLAMSVDERQAGAQFIQAYQTTVQRIREIISGLRPGMLTYGIFPALEELVDETTTQIAALFSQNGLAISLDLNPSEERYPAEVELQLYRIVQQACQNAVTHSQASKITISGELAERRIHLQVVDDGIGIEETGPMDLEDLLARKHFGLAGMYERAAVIGAKIDIQSTSGKGTCISVGWQENPERGASDRN